MQQEKKPWNERLRQERIRRNWRQREVAEMLGTTPITVTRWESGTHVPSAYFRVKLCALFEQSAEELGFLEMGTVTSPIEYHTNNLSEQHNQSSDHPATPISDNGLPIVKDSHIVPTSLATHSLVDHSAQSSKALPQKLLQRRKMLALAAGLSIATTTTLYWLAATKPSPHSKITRPTTVPQSHRSHQLLSPSSSNWVNHIAWSPDEHYLAVASGSNMTIVWSLEHNAIALSLPTLNKWVNDVSWSKTNLIASANAEAGLGSLHLWRFPEAKPVVSMKKPYALRSVCWSPDASYLAISGRNPQVEVCRFFPYHVVSRYTHPSLGSMGITRVKWSPSGQWLACAADDGTAHVWEALTGKRKVIYQAHTKRVHDLAWSPDEKFIITGSSDQTSHIWDVSSGKTLVVYNAQKGAINGVGWSPDGQMVASASADRTVHIWNPTTGSLKVLCGEYSSIVETPSWSINGSKLAIGTQGQGVEIWSSLS